jgi:hypothetical protein
METGHITPEEDTPLNRLFFALNYYISTGDRIGEGVALPAGQQGGSELVKLLIPVNTRMEQDQQDFAALRARLDQLGCELDDLGRQGVMHLHGLTVARDEMDALAQKLRAEPGPKGWGSVKETIDAHDWPGA